MIESLLKEYKVDYSLIEGDRYLYNGNPVPRVTEILSQLHEEYLMIWANALGFRRKKYQDERDRAAYIGTCVHNFAEEFIKTKMYKEQTKQDTIYYDKINNAVNSFLLWYMDVFENNNVDIVGIEEKLVCPWFGGTYDLLLRINRKLYLGDIKTSNHIGYKYFLQLAAYRYILRTIHNINIDGCLIIQLDKNSVSYEEYFLDFTNKTHLDFINQCETTFLSLIYTYYNKLSTIYMYNTIF